MRLNDQDINEIIGDMTSNTRVEPSANEIVAGVVAEVGDLGQYEDEDEVLEAIGRSLDGLRDFIDPEKYPNLARALNLADDND